MRMILIATLAVAVMISFGPQLSALVYADEGDPEIALGTQPLAKGANTSNAQILWYGGRNWDVIAYDGKDADGKTITYQKANNKPFERENPYPEGVVTLFEDGFSGVLEKSIFNHTGDDGKRSGIQNYGTDAQGVPSDLRKCIEAKYLNGDEQSLAFLNEKEVAAIAPRTLPGYGYEWDRYYYPDDYDSNRINGDDLKDALVWPLSEGEAGATDKSIRGAFGDYWLRTPGDTSMDEDVSVRWGARVTTGGEIRKTEDITHENYVRPAFYLNEAAVLFTSSVEFGEDSGKSGADALQKVGENSDNEWKVTVLDPARKFTAGFEELHSQMTIKIEYENAVTGQDEYISAVVVDKDQNITYYGRIKPLSDPSDAAGSFTLSLNNKLKDGCKVYVFNEHMNGDGYTDYASALQEITIPESMLPGNENQYQLQYDPGDGGSGSMAPETVKIGDKVILPNCSFIAPLGKKFNKWQISGVDGIFDPGYEYTVVENSIQGTVITVTATWKEAPSATVTTAPKAKKLTCTGASQKLVTAGAAADGVVNYAIGKDSITAPTSDWKEEIPKKAAAGTYYVWYKAAGDKTHSDSEAKCITVKIKQPAPPTPAQTVANEIRNLPDPVTLADRDKVEKVKEDYDALSESQQKQVPANLTEKLNKAVDTIAVLLLSDQIAQLPDPVTLNDETAVNAAVEAYDALTETQKAMVDPELLRKLTDAEATIKKELEDQNAAAKVSDMIAAIPKNPSQASRNQVTGAVKAYNSLTPDQKKLITDAELAKLQKALNYLAKKQKVKLKSVKAKKGKKAIAKWRKCSTANGYQLYYKAKGVKAKKVNIKSVKTLKKTVRKLKAGKVYTFKVRPYTMVQKLADPDKRIKVYGKWSNKKKVKAKKK